MTLRFVLVGLVTALGLDLPGGAEISSWVRSGRDWVQARLDSLSDGGAAESLARSDEEFSNVVDRMADGFSADLAALDRPRPRDLEAPRPIDAADVPGTVIASEMNRTLGSDAEGLEVESPIVDSLTNDAATSPGRLDRLVSAVRLTHQAASAWMAVFGDGGLTSIRR